MGPVVSLKQKERVLSFLDRGQEEGVQLLYGGGSAKVEGCESGYYVKPAMLSGPPENIAAQKEIFGPVAYVMPFETEEEGIRLANSTEYGLANSVWTNNAARASRVAEAMVAGNSWINAHNVFVHGVPYG